MTYDLASYVGYFAAVLVASSFCMKTMIPLRFLAIASNVAFIFYALLCTPILFPVLILHTFLFPLNIIRLRQAQKLIEEIRNIAHEQFSFDILIPYMSKELFQEGEVIFKKNDKADKMYIISTGRVHIVEFDCIDGPGDVLGEMTILGSNKHRTASAICLEKTTVLTIRDEQVILLCYQNPKFGFFLTKMAVNRLIENQGGRTLN